jgi:DNA-binding response OmpR family regulator
MNELLMPILKNYVKKIEKVGAQVIQTVWGVGYKFDDTEVGR